MVLEDFFARGGLFDVVIALFVWYLYYKIKKMPTNSNISRDVSRLKADVETTYVELWDYIENTMKPIRSRLDSRRRRLQHAEKREEEDLNVVKPKKGGIMTRSQLKKMQEERDGTD